MELGFLLELAKVMTVAALHREESRGGHFREDFPERDDENFMKHSMAYKDEHARSRSAESDRRHPHGHQTGGLHALRADGEEVLR